MFATSWVVGSAPVPSPRSWDGGGERLPSLQETLPAGARATQFVAPDESRATLACVREVSRRETVAARSALPEPPAVAGLREDERRARKAPRLLPLPVESRLVARPRSRRRQQQQQVVASRTLHAIKSLKRHRARQAEEKPKAGGAYPGSGPGRERRRPPRLVHRLQRASTRKGAPANAKKAEPGEEMTRVSSLTKLVSCYYVRASAEAPLVPSGPYATPPLCGPRLSFSRPRGRARAGRRRGEARAAGPPRRPRGARRRPARGRGRGRPRSCPPL